MRLPIEARIALRHMSRTASAESYVINETLVALKQLFFKMIPAEWRKKSGQWEAKGGAKGGATIKWETGFDFEAGMEQLRDSLSEGNPVDPRPLFQQREGLDQATEALVKALEAVPGVTRAYAGTSDNTLNVTTRVDWDLSDLVKARQEEEEAGAAARGSQTGTKLGDLPKDAQDHLLWQTIPLGLDTLFGSEMAIVGRPGLVGLSGNDPSRWGKITNLRYELSRPGGGRNELSWECDVQITLDLNKVEIFPYGDVRAPDSDKRYAQVFSRIHEMGDGDVRAAFKVPGPHNLIPKKANKRKNKLELAFDWEFEDIWQ